MHDKFTERVRKVIYLAREEAARLQQQVIAAARQDPARAAWLPYLEANLASYRAGQPARAPFAPATVTE